jgi:hypothetical protein
MKKSKVMSKKQPKFDKEYLRQLDEQNTILQNNPTFDDVYDIVSDMCNEQNLSVEERNFWIKCFAKTVLVK